MTKPRSSVCWECGKELGKKGDGGYYYTEKVVDGHPRIMHNSCANKVAKSRAFAVGIKEDPCPTKRLGGWKPGWSDTQGEN